jgi:hypothetical protein
VGGDGTAGASGGRNAAGADGASTVGAGVVAGGEGGSGGLVEGGSGGLVGVSWRLGSARAAALSCEAGAASSAAIGAGSNSIVTRPSAGISASLVWLANVSVRTSRQAACARTDSEIGAPDTVAARPRLPCGRSATKRASPGGSIAHVERPENSAPPKAYNAWLC